MKRSVGVFIQIRLVWLYLPHDDHCAACRCQDWRSPWQVRQSKAEGTGASWIEAKALTSTTATKGSATRVLATLGPVVIDRQRARNQGAVPGPR
jgi:hypothetical protein